MPLYTFRYNRPTLAQYQGSWIDEKYSNLNGTGVWEAMQIYGKDKVGLAKHKYSM